MKTISNITADGTDAMWEMIHRFEDQELDVETFRDRSHACQSLQAFRVPKISLEVTNGALVDECDDCKREAIYAHFGVPLAA